MKTFSSERFALSVSLTAALLCACGASQSSIGVPAAAPQDRSLSASSSSYNVLYRFDDAPDGASPSQGLIDVRGTLYGTTSSGGVDICAPRDKSGCGTFFSITPTGTETLLYSFTPQTGADPDGRLLHANGTFYGTTRAGPGYGTIYSVSATGSEKVLYTFPGANRGGGNPESGMIAFKDTFYGTAADDGGHSKDSGKVYSFTKSGQYDVLHTFKGGSDGSYPRGNLVAVRGVLYGTTSEGGASACNSSRGCGTVFSITPSGTENVLYRFAAPGHGQNPNGGLLNVNGTLYGTAFRGGSAGCLYGGGCGVVFTITTSGKERVLYKFLGGSDGGNPDSGLTDVNGTLYGTTTYGGSSACTNGCGTIYSISPSGAEKVLYAFAGGSDGQWPVAPLTLVHGMLYGETSGGGDPQKRTSCCGTIFTLIP